MVTIKGLGSFREVGRSSVLVEGTKRFLLDYGLNVQDMSQPIAPPEDLDAVFLSHAHLDHSTLIPTLYKRGYKGPTYATAATIDLAHLMLEDAAKVQEKRGLQPLFQPHDIDLFLEKSEPRHFQEEFTVGNATVSLHNAGHVPGSSMVLIELDGKRILYTGDAKFQDTALMRGAASKFKDIDLLICESTYTQKDHPDRKELQKELLQHVQDVVSNHGIVLLPAFAVGRSQELLQIIGSAGVPYYMDGMGKTATSLILHHPETLRDFPALKRAFGKAKKIRKHWERFKLLGKPGVVITTAGMLNGGPISLYIKKLHKREECSLYMSGYQVEGTVGRMLQDTGRYVNEGIDVKPKMSVMFRDWSAHAGRTGILNFINKINPKTVVFNHGSDCEKFATEVTAMGFQAHAPANGERLVV